MTEINASIPLSAVTPKFDLAGTYNKVAQIKDLQDKKDLRDQQLQALQSENELNKMKVGEARLNHIVDILGNVKDQESNDAALKNGIANGYISPQDAQQFALYDPNRIDSLRNTAAFQKKQLASQIQQSQLELEKAKANYYNGGAYGFKARYAREVNKLKGNNTPLGEDNTDTFSTDSTPEPSVNVMPNTLPSNVPSTLPATTETSVKPSASTLPSNMDESKGLNEGYLKTLDGGTAQEIKALAQGRMQFPNGTALKSPYWQQRLSQVAQYDPNFDTINYNSRSKARAAFTSGKQGTEINALNTAIGHLGDMKDAYKGLDNSDNHAWNTIANFVSGAGSFPAMKAFKANVHPLAEELIKAYKGTGGNIEDVKSYKEALDSSNTPEEANAALQKLGNLLKSKLDALNSSYKRSLGTAADDYGFLNPHSKESLAKLGLSHQFGLTTANTSSNKSGSGIDYKSKYGLD